MEYKMIKTPFFEDVNDYIYNGWTMHSFAVVHRKNLHDPLYHIVLERQVRR